MTAEVHARAISRRRIVQGAAWAAPAIMIATAAPAAAASLTPTVTVTMCEIYRSGNSDNFFAEITATTVGIPNGTPITLTGTFDAGTANPIVTDNSSGWAVTAGAKTGTMFTFIAGQNAGASGNLTVAKFKIDAGKGGAGQLLSKPITFIFTGLGGTLGSKTCHFPAA